MIKIQFKKIKETLYSILVKEGFSKEKAEQCALIFSENTLDGVASHGVNRFPAFIERARRGIMKIDTEPEKVNALGSLEQWDGKHGIGPLNALFCTERAIELAKQSGIGCVALKNTTHWMRAGEYGWKAAEKGYPFICWTNTMPNMPPWGAKARAIGNNPLVFSIPRKDGHIVLDMAISQFSYGKMGVYRDQGKKMPYDAGFDLNGKITNDPKEILKSYLALPVGFWKGSGLSIMLDLLAGVLSGGSITSDIPEEESNLSQVFIAFNTDNFGKYINDYAEKLVKSLKSIPDKDTIHEVLYPGEGSLKRRKDNLKNGIPVDQKIWEKIEKLAM
jgi:3-dehydro-L-gulonate 2-dehydrogenase